MKGLHEMKGFILSMVRESLMRWLESDVVKAFSVIMDQLEASGKLSNLG
jgi:hypothetical protein